MPRTTGIQKTAKLRDVKLDEVSFVGKGDNPEAHILLLKMKKTKGVSSVTKLGKECTDESTSVLLKWLKDNATLAESLLTKEDGEACTFEEIVNDRVLRDQIWNMVWTLEDSLGSIIRDDSVEDKTSMIQTTIDQFKAAVTAITKGEDEMPEKLQKQLEEATAKVATLEKENGELKVEVDALKAKTTPAEDGTCKTCGAKVKKEEDVFKGLPEAIAKEMKENREEIAKLKDGELTREYIGKAAAVETIGKSDEVGGILKDIAKHSTELADKVLNLFKTADTRIRKGGLLKEAGDTGKDTGATAYDKLVLKAEELRKEKPSLTKEQAFTAVYDSETELRKQYLEERNA